VNLASWQGGDAADLAKSLDRLTDQSVEAIALIADRPVAADALARVVAKVPVAVVALEGDFTAESGIDSPAR